jgi:hypothetical protein
LPTEAEWEFAARGGLEGAEFVWGDEFEPDGKSMTNTWQGDFPNENLLTDGFEWTAPVGSFPPNGYGLYEMAGNVWEWTTDWYQEHSKIQHSCCGNLNPRGGVREESFDPCNPERSDSTQGYEGRFIPVRSELLSPVSPGGADAAGCGYLDLPSWFSVHLSKIKQQFQIAQAEIFNRQIRRLQRLKTNK